MKYIDVMTANENIGWCKPLYDEKHNVFIIVNDGRAIAAYQAGKRIQLDTEEDIASLASIVNADYYELYSGWSAMHILLDADWKELGCADCPCCEFCEAVNGEIGEYQTL